MGKKLIIKGANFSQNAIEDSPTPVSGWVGNLTSALAVGADNVFGDGDLLYFGSTSIWNEKTGEYFKGKHISKIRFWSRGGGKGGLNVGLTIGYMDDDLHFVPLTQISQITHNSDKITLSTLAEAESAYNEIDVDINIPANNYLAVTFKSLIHIKAPSAPPLENVHSATRWNGTQWVTTNSTIFIDFFCE